MSAAAPIPGNKLRQAMIARGFGVTELAREAGVGINTVSRALAGRPVSLDVQLRLSVALAAREPNPDVERVLEELA